MNESVSEGSWRFGKELRGSLVALTLSARRPLATRGKQSSCAFCGVRFKSPPINVVAARRTFSFESSGTTSENTAGTPPNRSGSMQPTKSVKTFKIPTANSSVGLLRVLAKRRCMEDSNKREFKKVSPPRAFSSRRTASRVNRAL